ncbi:hypothetical protein ACHAXA_002131 [Cyclostephanos tholiformis]|uniref:Transcription initiation factor IIF subunit alpha n=1 Tax=Cyclostephanos tholiformis TaxID=382380 RepID=A0ABD3RT38_9STRA
MANTSRKRPPSPATFSAPHGAVDATESKETSSSSSSPSNPLLPSGIDALLAKYARRLPPGGSITVRLIKGSTSTSVDPIAARKAAASAAKRSLTVSNHSTSGRSSCSSAGEDEDDVDVPPPTMGAADARKNAPMSFPRMAKFVETVSPPDFGGALRDGRMYEEEVPKAKVNYDGWARRMCLIGGSLICYISHDESDEDESTAYKPSNLDASGSGMDLANPLTSLSSVGNKTTKKRRWRRNDPRPRRWVLQEKSEFFERIRKRKQRGGNVDDGPGISNQYHGVVESNSSRYVILGVAPASVGSAAPDRGDGGGGSGAPTVSETISVQPVYGFHTFSQPYRFTSLTMEEAEDAIERKRDVVTRYMMHGRLSSSSSSAAVGAMAPLPPTGRGVRPIGPPPKAMSRARLLGKLAGGGGDIGVDDDDDDVMGDVRYSSSSSGGGKRVGASRARRELLSTLGDEGVTVDDDGVLGGANDAEFGGRGSRFKRIDAKGDDDGDAVAKTGSVTAPTTTSTGFEAGAMEDGFYQRDVAAEYEALDYDANEQFDDDDVNVGEDEMMDDGGGYGGDFSGDDNALESDDEEAGSDDDVFRGMATSSGLKAMLARTRGESPVNATGVDSAGGAGFNASDPSSVKNGPDGISGANVAGAGGGDEGIDRMIDAAKKTAEKLKSSSTTTKSEEKNGSPSRSAASVAEAAIAVDKDGKRLITLEAVQREIWLNNGAITSKRLTKKFEVGKKNPERQALFKRIVMELCTIKKDADGNKLVLKQHYSKIS